MTRTQKQLLLAVGVLLVQVARAVLPEVSGGALKMREAIGTVEDLCARVRVTR